MERRPISERYALMSPRDRLVEMSRLYNFIPRVSLPSTSNEILQRLNQFKRRLTGEGSQIKQVILASAQELFVYACLTPSGQEYLLLDLEEFMDNGILDNFFVEDTLFGLYGWRADPNKEAQSFAIFDPVTGIDEERSLYRRIANTQIHARQFSEDLLEDPEFRKRIGEVISRVKDITAAPDTYQEEPHEQDFMNKVASREERKRNALRKWRLEIIERDGDEP